VDLIRDVYSEAWSLYKTHWRHLLTLAFVVYLAVAVIGTLLVAVLTWLGALIAALIALIALFWLQAALVKAVEDVRDGRADMSLSETFEAARAHLAAVFVAGFIARGGGRGRPVSVDHPGPRGHDLLRGDRAGDRDRRP
jgi:hypothetical protein